MKYLTLGEGYEELGDAWVEYRMYLMSVKDALPQEVFEFAAAKWHYDPADHRSLHDSWVEAMTIREVPARYGQQDRTIEIDVELLGPFHDGRTTLSYIDVTSYTVSLASDAGHGAAREDRAPPGPASRRGHGDWLIDEVRLSDDGRVLHEVIFDSGARWTIECKTIRHATTAPAASDWRGE